MKYKDESKKLSQREKLNLMNERERERERERENRYSILLETELHDIEERSLIPEPEYCRN